MTLVTIGTANLVPGLSQSVFALAFSITFLPIYRPIGRKPSRLFHMFSMILCYYETLVAMASNYLGEDLT